MTLLKILNAFAGIGGNRFYWDQLGNFEITALENNPIIAEEYSKLFPHDKIIIDDAWNYIQSHVENYDIIWASPPCRTHSRVIIAAGKKVFPDLRLYSLIIFLNKYFPGKWVVENVEPYYKNIISLPGKKIGRHLFWSNVDLNLNISLPSFGRRGGFMKQRGRTKDYVNRLEKYLGFKISRKIYLNNTHDYGQVYRNCVHPILGKHILEQLIFGPGPILIDYLVKSSTILR